jgi:pyruvate formate lyase activating enzyme
MAGKILDPEAVIAEVLKDKVFYEASGGGLTLSGGEPLFQGEFAAAVLGLAKARNIHTCVETSGFGDPGLLEALVPLTDIFLFDYKERESGRHKAYTGVSSDLILRNLTALDELGAKIILRCPIIPGINDRPDHFKGISGTAGKLKNILEIHVEPYHPLGESKSRNLGKAWGLGGLGFPPEEAAAGWIAAIQADTAVPVKKA